MYGWNYIDPEQHEMVKVMKMAQGIPGHPISLTAHRLPRGKEN